MPNRSSNKGETPAAKKGVGNHSGVAANKGKHKLDPNQIAFNVVQQAIGEAPQQEEPTTKPKNPAAVTLGRLGGLKGGKARADKLTPGQRAEIAKKAAEKRWRLKP